MQIHTAQWHEHNFFGYFNHDKRICVSLSCGWKSLFSRQCPHTFAGFTFIRISIVPKITKMHNAMLIIYLTLKSYRYKYEFTYKYKKTFIGTYMHCTILRKFGDRHVALKKCLSMLKKLWVVMNVEFNPLSRSLVCRCVVWI